MHTHASRWKEQESHFIITFIRFGTLYVNNVQMKAMQLSRSQSKWVAAVGIISAATASCLMQIYRSTNYNFEFKSNANIMATQACKRFNCVSSCTGANSRNIWIFIVASNATTKWQRTLLTTQRPIRAHSVHIFISVEWTIAHKYRNYNETLRSAHIAHNKEK